MKIAFICGSLEPGRDGVGDYTRRLAVELILQGHQVVAVALNDPHIYEQLDCIQEVDGVSLQVLRMPAVMSNRLRFKFAKSWIEKFRPKWISLQFVPYAFHSKGMPFFLGRQIKSLLVKGRRAHIMFHETWIGVENRMNWKRAVTAYLQRKIIKKLIKTVRPRVIHTQLPKTLHDLEKIFPAVKKLPLFSNIDLVKSEDENTGILRVGIFSQAEASGSIINFLTSLGQNAAKEHMQIELLLIGGEDSRMKAVGNILENIESLKNRVTYTGFLSPVNISHALQSCSLGITTVPRHALGKSGSVAAFLTHGIPVAAPNIHQFQDPMEIGFFSMALRSAILLVPCISFLRKAKHAAMEARVEISVAEITKTFISSLV